MKATTPSGDVAADAGLSATATTAGPTIVAEGAEVDRAVPREDEGMVHAYRIRRIILRRIAEDHRAAAGDVDPAGRFGLARLPRRYGRLTLDAAEVEHLGIPRHAAHVAG